MTNNLKITVLGTGTSVGIPALGKLGWGKCDPSNPKNKRQRCSLLVQNKDTNILIDAGPDIKNQLIEHHRYALLVIRVVARVRFLKPYQAFHFQEDMGW